MRSVIERREEKPERKYPALYEYKPSGGEHYIVLVWRDSEITKDSAMGTIVWTAHGSINRVGQQSSFTVYDTALFAPYHGKIILED